MSERKKPKILKTTEFGNPILRRKIHELSKKEILSDKIQQLIADMQYTLEKKKYGVGIAAPQLGNAVSIGIINIRPTRIRPTLATKEWRKMVVINPKITKTYDQQNQMWEGCLSLPKVFAKVPRYKKIRVRYTDEQGKEHQEDFEGLIAQVLQHEIGHLNGELFVDKVQNTSTFMSEAEFTKRIVRKAVPNKNKSGKRV